MKQILYFLTILGSIFNVYAIDKTVKTKPEKVIVYTSGAQIYRSNIVAITPGENIIIFNGLENCINASAIQASGNGNCIISETQYVVFTPTVDMKKLQNDDKYNKLFKLVKDSLALINNLIEDIAYKQEVIQTEKNVLLNFPLYKYQSKKDSLPYLMQGLAYLKTQLSELNFSSLKHKRDQDALRLLTINLNARLKKYQDEFALIDNNNTPQQTDYQIHVHINSETVTTVTLNLNYYITQAGWYPMYDLNAVTNEPNIQLTHKAAIYQQSGIEWSNVKLTLSTANPSRNINIPVLYSWYIYQNIPIAYNNVKKLNSKSWNNNNNNDYTKSEDMKTLSDMTVMESNPPQAMTAANVTFGEQNMIEQEFEIKLNYNITSSEKQHYVTIAKHDLKAAYRYKAIPKLNANVYLTALITDWEDKITSAGATSIYFDGTYVGNTDLSPFSIDDTLQFSLGIDKQIVVKRKKIKEKCSEKFLDSDRINFIAYDIIVKNARPYKIEIEIQDQLPLSQDPKIVIEKKNCRMHNLLRFLEN